jgi:hypothetical protein
LILPGARQASAPASAPTEDDRRSIGAVLARRVAVVLFFASSGMVGSAGAAPAASSHLYPTGRAGIRYPTPVRYRIPARYPIPDTERVSGIGASVAIPDIVSRAI